MMSLLRILTEKKIDIEEICKEINTLNVKKS